ncbi:glycosyl hydrolase 108 family protein [Niveispirillum irakense]|uniref:glycosyl hydrolase 108 family protein n=1 Tax=Niveispirillum irakense TaxID=34011 RepID=UPI0003F841E6|nr:glycosyl hydrolase 108 family protein [Niveispirillum irakense]
MAYPTPATAFQTAIAQWEGLWEDDPNDTGNYANCAAGGSTLIGTMRGVTPDVYGAYLKVDPCSLSASQMQQGVTLAVAADIAVTQFYQGPGLNQLTWSPLVAIVMDFGWTSGPGQAVSCLQGLVGASQDGIPGPETSALVNQYIAAQGIAPACDAMTAARVQFYQSISQPGTPDFEYRDGWVNRANWFLSSNPSPCWWDAWKGWVPPVA